jgi:hypothetical protein
MTLPCRTLLVATLGLITLSGCDQGKDERAQAAGEILEGTASDAMLETDQIRSEAPLAPRKAGSGGSVKAGRGDAAKSASEPTTETPAPAPVETSEQPAAAPTAAPAPPSE